MSQKQKLDFFSKVEKMNSELLTFTYGSLIVRLIKDFEKVEEINEQLDKMGYNIGIRITDDFLSKSSISQCSNFKETVDVIAKNAFKMYLGINCDVLVYSEKEYGLIFSDNPLNDYVELPEKYQGLWYSNLLCGIIRGSLEIINIKVETKFSKDILKGNDTNEIRIKLIEIIEEKFVDDDS